MRLELLDALGSFFITDLADVFEENANGTELQDLLKMVILTFLNEITNNSYFYI